MRQYRVAWISGPDGRVIESYRRELRSDAEFLVRDLFPKIGEDELLVFEVAGETLDPDGSHAVSCRCGQCVEDEGPLHSPGEDCDGGPSCPWHKDRTHDDG